MNYDGLPQYVLVKLLALDEAVASLKAGADAIERGIEDRRARLWGNVRRADDKPRRHQFRPLGQVSGPVRLRFDPV